MGYRYAERVRYDYQAGDATLTAFPLPIALDGSNFSFATARADGSDIYFRDGSDQTLLYFDRAAYYSESQRALFYVHIPIVPAAQASLFIEMRWGDPAAPDSNCPGLVWGERFRAVYHFEETGFTFLDSTGSAPPIVWTGHYPEARFTRAVAGAFGSRAISATGATYGWPFLQTVSGAQDYFVTGMTHVGYDAWLVQLEMSGDKEFWAARNGNGTYGYGQRRIGQGSTDYRIFEITGSRTQPDGVIVSVPTDVSEAFYIGAWTEGVGAPWFYAVGINYQGTLVGGGGFTLPVGNAATDASLWIFEKPGAYVLDELRIYQPPIPPRAWFSFDSRLRRLYSTYVLFQPATDCSPPPLFAGGSRYVSYWMATRGLHAWQ